MRKILLQSDQIQPNPHLWFARHMALYKCALISWLIEMPSKKTTEPTGEVEPKPCLIRVYICARRSHTRQNKTIGAYILQFSTQQWAWPFTAGYMSNSLHDCVKLANSNTLGGWWHGLTRYLPWKKNKKMLHFVTISWWRRRDCNSKTDRKLKWKMGK